MSKAADLQLSGAEHSKPFMSAEEYRTFAENFRQLVKPILDQQREARIRSEEEAKKHLVS